MRTCICWIIFLLLAGVVIASNGSQNESLNETFNETLNLSESLNETLNSTVNTNTTVNQTNPVYDNASSINQTNNVSLSNSDLINDTNTTGFQNNESNSSIQLMQAFSSNETPPPIEGAGNEAPKIELIAPSMNSVSNQTYVHFNFTVTDDSAIISSCTLYTDNSGSFAAEKTITSIPNASTQNISLLVYEGEIAWYIACTDSGSLTNYSENYTFTSDINYNGLLVYENRDNANVFFRFLHPDNTFGGQRNTEALSADITWNVIRSNHQRDEYVLVTEDKTPRTHFQVYSEGEWSNPSVLARSVSNAAYRSFDVEVEQVSGDVLIVYEKGGLAQEEPLEPFLVPVVRYDKSLYYRIWNGTLSSEYTLSMDLTNSGDARWVSLHPKSSSDNIMLLVQTDGGRGVRELYAIPWNGTAFETGKDISANPDTTSSTEQHFHFSWEQSGQGLLSYGDSSSYYYRTYSPNPPYWSTAATIYLGNSLDAAYTCSHDSSDNIGVIFQDSGNDVNARIWDGSTWITGISQDSSTEPNGYNNRNIACEWKNDTAVFFYVDANYLSVSYFNYSLNSGTWSVSSIVNSPKSFSFAYDDIMGLYSSRNPFTDEIMLIAQDIDEYVTGVRYTASGFTSLNERPLSGLTEVANAAQQSAMFDYNRLDHNPYVDVSSINDTAVSELVQIEAQVTDDNKVGTVQARITFPDNSTTIISMSGAAGNYNATFSNTSQMGSYNVTILAYDTGLHNNLNDSESVTFDALDSTAPNVTDAVPSAASSFQPMQNIEISVNVSDNQAVSNVSAVITYPNSTQLTLQLIHAAGSKYNNTFIAPYRAGRYNISYFANDTSGNVNDTLTSYFFVTDLINPSVTFISPPSNDSVDVANEIQIVANVTDNTVVQAVYVNITRPDNGTETLSLVYYDLNQYNNSYTVPLIAGRYNLTIAANDTEGNVNDTETSYFNAADSSAPLISFIIPSSGDEFDVETEIEIACNVTDNTDVDTVYVNITYPNGTMGQLQLSGSNKYNNSFIIPILLGRYNLTFDANDTSGNNNISTSYFTAVDQTAPNVTGVLPLGDSYSIAQLISIEANVSDDFDVSFVVARVTDPNMDSTDYFLSNETADHFNVTITAPALQGDYTIRITANDAQGNTNNTEEGSFTVLEQTAPAVTDIHPSSVVFEVSDSVTIEANISDNNGIDYAFVNLTYPNSTTYHIELINNKTTWTAPDLLGVYDLRFIVNDTYGNLNYTQNSSFTVEDSVKPFVSVISPVQDHEVADNVTFSAYVTDNAQVENVWVLLKYPNTTQVLLDTIQNGSYYNVSEIVRAQGIYNITIIANDTHLNTNDTESVIFRVNDTTKPSVSEISPIENSSFNVGDIIEIGANATDNNEVSKVYANVTYPNTTTEWIELTGSHRYNSSFTVPNVVGRYNVTFICNDTNNNINGTETSFFVAGDPINPVINELAPNGEEYGVNETVLIQVNVTDNVEVDTIIMTIDYPDNTSLQEEITFNYSFVSPNILGRYNITIFSNDTSANTKTNYSYFMVNDTIAPYVEIQYDRGVNVSGNVIISADVYDAAGVDYVYARVTYPNSTVEEHELTRISQYYTYNFTAPNLKGRYNYTIYANDTNGNVNGTQTDYFIVDDNIRPSVSDVLPAAGTAHNIGTEIELKAACTDNAEIDTALALVNLPNGTNTSVQLNAPSYNNSFLIEADARHNITFIVNDTSGNINQSTHSFFLTADNVTPTVWGALPDLLAFNVSDNITISVNATDNAEISSVFALVDYPNATQQLLQLTKAGITYTVQFTAPDLLGEYNLTYLVNDTNGNENNTVTSQFNVLDNSVPVLSSPVPAFDENHSAGSVLSLSVVVEDNAEISLVEAYIVMPNGSSQRLTMSGSYNASFEIPYLLGLYNVTFNATDTHNNTNQTYTNFTTYDGEDPLISGVLPSAQNYNLYQDVMISANVTDSIQLDSVTVFIAYPNSSNTTLILHNYPPTEMYNNTFDIPVLIGRYNFTIYANDTSSNTALLQDYFTAVDNTSPGIIQAMPDSVNYNISEVFELRLDFNEDVGISNATALITYPNTTTASVSLSHVNISTYNSSWSADQPGDYTIFYFVNDTSGNSNSTTINFSATDTTSPVIVDYAPDANNYTVAQNITISINSTDNVVVESEWVVITFPNTTVQRVTSDSFVIPYLIGNYSITFYVNDTSSNSVNLSSYFIALDESGPETANISPQVGSVYGISHTFEVGLDAEDDIGVDAAYAVIYYPNSTTQTIELVGSRMNNTFTPPALLGNYNISIHVNDTSSNTVTNHTNFTVIDNSTPAVESIFEMVQADVNSTIEIYASVIDDLAVDKVRARIVRPDAVQVYINLTEQTGKYNNSYDIPFLTGRYEVFIEANDTSGNLNNTQNASFTGTDSVYPSVLSLACVPYSANLSDMVICNISASDNVGIDGVSVVLNRPDDTSQTIFTYTNYSVNVSNTTITGNYTLLWVINDSSSNTVNITQNFSVSDVTNPQVIINSPVNYHNASSDVTFNFTLLENYDTALNCTLCISSNCSVFSAYNGSNTVSRGFADGEHNWNITCTDNSFNTNHSETRVITMDSTPPSFVSLDTIPSHEDDIDPGVMIVVKAEVTDEVMGVQNVTLQKSLNSSDYANLSMEYNASDGFYYYRFNATEAHYSLRLYGNDSLGNADASHSINFTSAYDHTWSFIPSSITPITASLNENVTLVNLTINNTGDFAVTVNLTSDSDDTMFNQTTLTIGSKGSAEVMVNETADVSGVKTVLITGSSQHNTKTITGNIVVAPGQPVLITTFTAPFRDPYTVTQGDTQVQFTASVENIGEGNATDVNISIEIPEEWTITFGERNISFGELDSGDIGENILEVTIPSDETGTHTIRSNVTGSNSSGTALRDLNLSFGDTTIIIIESDTLDVDDGGGSSGDDDDDNGNGDSGNAASGGGSGVSINKLVDALLSAPQIIHSSETFHLVRGKEDTFIIHVTNIFPQTTLTDVNLYIEGFNSHLLKVLPQNINTIPYGKKEGFEIIIQSPKYMEQNTHYLTVKLKGRIIGEGLNRVFIETRDVLLKIHSVSKQDVENAILTAQEKILDMEKNQISVKKVQEKLVSAKNSLSDDDYDTAYAYTQEIGQIRDKAMSAKELLFGMENSLSDYTNSMTGGFLNFAGIIRAPFLGATAQTKELVRLAMAAFEREDFDTAIARLKDAQFAFAVEQNDFSMSRFLLQNWWAVLLGAMIVSTGGTLGTREYRKVKVVHSINKLNKQEEVICSMIKQAQEDRFAHKRIGVETYSFRIAEYNDSIGRIKKKRSQLRTKRLKLLNPQKIRMHLKRERNDLLDKIKHLQENYLLHGRITKDQFAGYTKNYQDRLAEIEQEQLMIDIK